MKKLTLTIATIMVLIISAFAQHSNCNSYSQQSYLVYGNGNNSPYTTYTINGFLGNHNHHQQYNYYSQNNYNNSNSCNSNYDENYSTYNCNHDSYNNNYNNNSNYIYPMNERDFENAKQCIASKGFDETRLVIAKQVIGNNHLLSCQIKQLMELMSFESTKMALAKYAWRHTIDRENYYKLNDAFAFESSIYELNQYTSYN